MRRPQVFWVLKEGGRWAVRPQQGEIIASFETRAEAKAYAKQIAKTAELSRVYLENDARAVERELVSGWGRAMPPTSRTGH